MDIRTDRYVSYAVREQSSATYAIRLGVSEVRIRMGAVATAMYAVWQQYDVDDNGERYECGGNK